MVSPDASLPAVFVHVVVAVAAGRGVDREALLAATGLCADELASPENPVPLGAVFAVWEHAMRALDDPGFPLAYARAFSIEQYPLLGFATMTAPSGREAFARMLRFGSLLTRSGHFTAEETGERYVLTWHREGRRTLGHRVANEANLAEVIHSVRQVLGRDVRALGVRFRHPAPRDTRAHEAHFGSRVVWDAEVDALVLPRSVLELVPRFANSAMSAHFERLVAERLRESRGSERLIDAVARLVGDELVGGEPSLERVARALATSDRSLRRALATEGTSFRAVVEGVRRARARELVADPKVSLAEVAFALGFSEHAAFTRAYKRWTGQAPAETRRAELRR